MKLLTHLTFLLLATSLMSCESTPAPGDAGRPPNDAGRSPDTPSSDSGPALICLDTCPFAGDDECDDGAPDSMTDECFYGTDCTDCGPRPPLEPDAGTPFDSGPNDCPCDTTLIECDEGCDCDASCDVPATGESCFCEADYCAGPGDCGLFDVCSFRICKRRCNAGCPDGTACMEYSSFHQVCE